MEVARKVSLLRAHPTVEALEKGGGDTVGGCGGGYIQRDDTRELGLTGRYRSAAGRERTIIHARAHIVGPLRRVCRQVASRFHDLRRAR